MIKSAKEHPVHILLSNEDSLVYRVPPYQRGYSWTKRQWEELLTDLVEEDGDHFLGTIITLNTTEDAADVVILELIDGQQRMTTLTLLLAAIYSVLREHRGELDEESAVELFTLGQRLFRKGRLRVVPQIQGSNLDDYRAVFADVGFQLDHERRPYFRARPIAKCFNYFRESIVRLGADTGEGQVAAALALLSATKRAILVKIEVDTRADAYTLFESLNNRGMPLTPLDLIKNHLFAEAERRKVMTVDAAFKRWNSMLNNLGDDSATHERFLRHFYNAFKGELPDVPNASEATKTKLIRIFEKILAEDLAAVLSQLVDASAIYGRVTTVLRPDHPTKLDDTLQRLARAQGAPAYLLVLWLVSKRQDLELDDDHIASVVDGLTAFFVRRNLTGYPQTYGLTRLFMSIISRLDQQAGKGVVDIVLDELEANSASDDEFRRRLAGRIYQENSDVARFVLATLAEDAMTKESWRDLWALEKGRYLWTIEHVLPQGENLPDGWIEMLGGAEEAARIQEAETHRLGNLTISAFNSSLGNMPFVEKRDRTDNSGRPIGYKNGLSLNADLAGKESWAESDIQERTNGLIRQVMSRFQVGR